MKTTNLFAAIFIIQISSLGINIAYAQKNEVIAPPDLSNSEFINAEVPVKTFGEINPEIAVDLMDVYDLTADNDPSLRSVIQRSKSVEEEIIQARSDYLPQVSYGASYGLVDIDQDNRGGNNVDDRYEDRSVSINLSQTVFNKETLSNIDASKIASGIAKTTLSLKVQQLQLDTAIAYLQLLSAQDRLDTALKQVDNTREQFLITKERYDVGLGTITDFYQAQSRLSLAESDLAASKNTVTDAEQAILSLSGKLIKNIKPLSPQYPITGPNPNNLEYWVDTSLSNNLSIMQARQAIDLSDENIDLARAEYWPSLNVVAEQTKGQIGNSNFSDGDNDSAQVLLQLQGKLYQGGRLRSQVKQAEIDHQANIAEYDNIVRNIRQQSTNAFNAVQASIIQVDALKEAYLSAEKTLRAREETFKAGLNTNLEVLDAIRDWFDARSEYLASRYQHAVNLLTLKQRSGLLSINDLQNLNAWMQETSNEESMEVMNEEMRQMDNEMINNN